MSRGYTLFELLVALAIVGLVLASVPVVAGMGRQGPAVRAAAYEVASGLRSARSLAILQYQPVVFELDVEGHSYRIGAAERQSDLPGGLEISLYTARSELVEESVGRVRFFADGSATGGHVTLTSGHLSYRVTIDWLTGAVAVEG